MKKRIILILLLIYPLYLLLAQGALDPTKVIFLNEGSMRVNKDGNTTAIYIKGAMHNSGDAAIRQDGETKITGNFYHDANTNVFYKENNDFPSTGRIVFSGNNSAQRLITTLNNSIDDFSRANYFIAFPEIEIETTDELLIPAKMGIDALKIIRTNQQSGKMRLASQVYTDGSSSNVYNASLRITGTGTSSTLVPPGAVIVELNVEPYRVEKGTTGAGPLFPFASPFYNTQRSGYFAGNWVRRMIEDENGHVDYVYGNKSSNGIIIRDQYLSNPDNIFTAGKGYLLKLRKSDYDYEELIEGGGLGISGGNPADYNKSIFIFDGKPYTMSSVSEQLFAEDVLFTHTLSNSAKTNTINWIIGNSYTAPIGIDKLIEVIGNTSLSFEPNIYVFPKGSTTYQIYKVSSNSNSMQVIDIDEIPSMSYFMLRVSKNKVQNGSLTLRKSDLLTHGNSPHAFRAAKNNYYNEVVFRISPEENHNIYDIAGIGLRPNATSDTDKNDILKVFGNSDMFQVYTLAEDGQKLSGNIIPEDASHVVLCINPGNSEGTFLLETERLESMHTDGLWMEDTKEGKIVDLLATDGKYTFEVHPNDAPERFYVFFSRSSTTGDGNSIDSLLQIFYNNNSVSLHGLCKTDINSFVGIYDVQGKLIYQDKIKSFPEENFNVQLEPGVYIVRLEGQRTSTLKFLAK